MNVLKTVVFPALRILIWGAIAVALLVLAFGRGTDAAVDEAGGAGAPTVDLTTPELPVGRGTVMNTVDVQGTVAADPAVTVKATAAGKVRRLLVKQGSTIQAGAPVIEITYEVERPPLVGKDPQGNPTMTPQTPLVKTATVPAPASGTLATLTVLVDQIMAVGDPVGTVSPGTLSVTAPVTQAQQFRLLTPPGQADVEVQGGPGPFACTGLTLGAAPTAPETPDSGSSGVPVDPNGGGAAGGGTTARCAVPPGTTVFPGMGARMTIQAGLAENVLVVPVTAVQGSVQSGRVWIPGADGEPVERPVTLGLTDGDQVEVTGGLTEGEMVLQFVPIPDDDVVDPNTGGMFGG